MDIIDGFPVGWFIFLAIASLGLCIGLSLLIMARISDDKNNSALKQIWDTFFGKPTPPSENLDDLGNHEQD